MKKFKFLSSMLAVFMVLSMITVMPVGAAGDYANSFFCDFEDFTLGTLTTAGCTQNGFSWVYGPQNGFAESDAAYGNAVGVTSTFALGVNFDAPVTTGKVRAGFSFKQGSWGYLYLVNDTPTSWDSTSGKRKAIINFGANGIALLDSAASGVSGGSKSVGTDTWCYVECVVDIDANSWTLYVDGKKIKDYTWADGENDTIANVGGFCFYNGGARETCGLIDNIAVSVEQDNMQIISSDAEDGMITVAFSEKLADGITKDDIAITKCGSTDSIAVDDVAQLDNKVMITCASKPELGMEYAVSFKENVKSLSGKVVNGEAYIYQSLESSQITKTELKNFDATTEDVDTYANILCRNAHLSDSTKTTGLSYTTVDSTQINGTNASGSALGLTCYEWGRILELIGSEDGVETYEFDFRATGVGYNGGGQFVMFADSEATVQLVKTAISSNWKHLKIEYDTVTDTVTTYLDGSTTFHKQVTDMSNFNTRPRFMLYSASAVTFELDNYTSYLTLTPLNIEKIRYTDASGKVTGSNVISPEISKIDITFTDAIDTDAMNAITLTADGENVTITNREITGTTVTLELDMLPGGKDIELAIPAADRVYNIKTAAGKFEISDLDITVNGSKVTAAGTTGAEGDAVVITAEVINTEAEPQNLVVVYAYYYDDQLVDVDCSDVSIDATKYTKSISEEFTTKANVQYDKVKAFIWDGLTTATPLTVAASYPAE